MLRCVKHGSVVLRVRRAKLYDTLTTIHKYEDGRAFYVEIFCRSSQLHTAKTDCRRDRSLQLFIAAARPPHLRSPVPFATYRPFTTVTALVNLSIETAAFNAHVST